MERIIMDSYVKQDKQIYGEDRDLAFNKRVLAINAMYGWLNEQEILEKITFAYQDCPEDIHFALDARDLETYRKAMEESKLPEAALAVQHLLDEPYTPCVYSGAIQPGWLMNTYREISGPVLGMWPGTVLKRRGGKRGFKGESSCGCESRRAESVFLLSVAGDDRRKGKGCFDRS